MFWLATTLAWVRHVRVPSRRRLALAVVLYALGLASKAMLVTLPFTLLLLDVWHTLAGSISARHGWAAIS